jgi:hypothetical protein
MKGGNTSGNVPAPSEDKTDECSEGTSELQTTTDTQDAVDCVTTEEPPNILNEPPFDTESEVIQQPRPSKKRTETPNNKTDAAFIEWLGMKKRRETRKTEEEERDADWLFFKSMLPDFKKLDSRRKRALKAKFLLLLNEQVDESEKELPVTPSSQWTSSDDSSSISASTFVPSSVTTLPPDPNPAVDAQLQ